MQMIRAGVIYAVVSASLVLLAVGGHPESIVSSLPIDRTDALQFYWNGWWLQQSVSQAGNPYYCNLVFAPKGTPLVFHSVDPVESGIMAAIGTVAPLWIAYDLTVAAGLLLAGIGGYALCKYLTGHEWASIVGGLVFLLCPFIIGKAGAGHLNLLFAGVLPLFFAALLRALEGSHRGGWQLAAAWLLVVFTSLLNVILCANIAVFVVAWSLLVIGKRSPAQHLEVLLPAVLVTIPIACGIAYYALTYGVTPQTEAHYSNLPEPISYLLPFTPTSAYSAVIQRMMSVHPDLMRFDTSAYLGWLVFPLAIAGICLNWRMPVARLLAFLLAFFLVISLGQVLLIHRAPVRFFSVPIYLPFAIWRRIPGLGGIWQSGRYLAIVYTAMAAGIALFISSRPTRKSLCAAVVAALVCLDYLPHLKAATLPPALPPALQQEKGSVLDSRRTGLAMYQQTQYRRPMVGGYLNRSPKKILDEYRSIPGMDCLFWGDHCVDEKAARSAAATLSIAYVFLAAGDPRAHAFESFHFVRIYADANTEVWQLYGLPRRT